VSAVVDIVDVCTGAVKVQASDVRPGDSVFDAFGGRHTVRKVTNTGLEVRIKREDGWMSRHTPDGTITIVRA
jgi:hypothetical protein